MDTSLSSLLGHADAELFMQRHWPERSFVVHRTLEDLPAVLRPELLLEPSQLTRVYRGVVEVTNGKRGQFRLTGADPVEAARAAHGVAGIVIGHRGALVDPALVAG